METCWSVENDLMFLRLSRRWLAENAGWKEAGMLVSLAKCGQEEMVPQYKQGP